MSNFITQALEDLWDKTNHLLKVGLSAGSSIIGKVSIDQTTPGTTNYVATDVKNVLDASMGNAGGAYSTAATITPAGGYVFNSILVVSDTVITCAGNITGLTSIPFPAGSIIPGRFTSITIASGAIIAYQGV